MKPILVSTVREIIKGSLATGVEDRLIVDVRRFIRRVDKRNMLTFIWKNEKPNWERIKKYSPCTIVTSQFFEEYKSIDGCTVILVNNVEAAYWSFVKYYRSSFKIPIIAVSGTCGKTSTKDMIKHILSHYMKVASTVRSFNGNHRNLPYLLRINDSTQAAVFETPVGSPGDLKYACRHFKPDIGIITNIGSYHLDRCRTVERYIKAKAEMVSGLGNNGILILNSDDENIKKINLKNFKGRIIYFGVKNKADFQASDIKYSNYGMEFLLNFQDVKYPVFVLGYGEHQVYNALAAIAAVHELGIEISEAVKVLASYKNLPHHLEILNGLNGSILIDDTWNFNSTGLAAALKTLVNIANGKKKVAVVGRLMRLGEHSEDITTGVGHLIADLGIDQVVIFGDTAEAVANTIKEKREDIKINIFKDTTGISDLLKEILDENTVLLVKCYGTRINRKMLNSLKANSSV
jgi:UDP-N-acetylmuramoyl-tripeptide--D-alanyl-D-alanine ligase